MSASYPPEQPSPSAPWPEGGYQPPSSESAPRQGHNMPPVTGPAGTGAAAPTGGNFAPPLGYMPPGYAPGPYAAYAPIPARANSGWSLASLIVGLVGLCPLLSVAGIAAVICGHIGLNEVNRAGGRLGGRGLAIGGLILGYIEIAGMALWALHGVLQFALFH